MGWEEPVVEISVKGKGLEREFLEKIRYPLESNIDWESLCGLHSFCDENEVLKLCLLTKLVPNLVITGEVMVYCDGAALYHKYSIEIGKGALEITKCIFEEEYPDEEFWMEKPKKEELIMSHVWPEREGQGPEGELHFDTNDNWFDELDILLKKELEKPLKVFEPKHFDDLNLVVKDGIVSLGTYEGGILEWRILDETEGAMLLLCERPVLQSVAFDSANYWSKSPIRRWLNKVFLSEALGDYKDCIIETDVVAHQNPIFDKKFLKIFKEKNPDWDEIVESFIKSNEKDKQGPNTKDKIFLLSVEEVERYMIEEKDRILNYHGPHPWWLRTTGTGSARATNINEDGSIDYGLRGPIAYMEELGVRPAMWVRK